jgi:hypothetical protein
MKWLAWIAALLWLAAPGSAEELSAEEIMQRVDDRDDGDRSVRELQMVLIDKNGGERLRRMRSWSRDEGEDVLSILFFMSPADVQDTGFLTYDYDGDRDDDQWLYLPALQKTKRIASSDKSGSFVGSDFSYADLTDREVDRYDWTLMKDDVEVHGHSCWQIQGIPNTPEEIEETGYTKLIVFVRKDNLMVVRALSWLEKGGRLKYMDAAKVEQIDGIWVATEIHMTTKKGKTTQHKTVMRSENVRFDQDLDPDFFSVRRLEKGL